jgi:glycerol-3-phosphate acyltransferase PlsY
MEIVEILIIIISYIIGCFTTGYYYTRIKYRQDIRSIGTNVTGAVNVSRIAGKKGFAITFLGDALKGAIVVLLCRIFKLNDITTLLCILMVLLGHIFPFQLKFQGGKGLSTIFGALLAYNPMLIVFLVITCAVILPFIRRNTITCLFAFMLLPLELFIADYKGSVITFITIYTLVILFACRSNLKEYVQNRALQGKEYRGGKTHKEKNE